MAWRGNRRVQHAMCTVRCPPSCLPAIPDIEGQSLISGAVPVLQMVCGKSQRFRAHALEPRVSASFQLYAHPWYMHTVENYEGAESHHLPAPPIILVGRGRSGGASWCRWNDNDTAPCCLCRWIQLLGGGNGRGKFCFFNSNNPKGGSIKDGGHTNLLNGDLPTKWGLTYLMGAYLPIGDLPTHLMQGLLTFSMGGLPTYFMGAYVPT